MDDLIAFLNARLDEDEAAAKEARGVEWDWRHIAQPFGDRPSIAHTVHIARHDPARVLREVEAKRAILTLHSPEPGQHPDFCGHDMHELPCPTLRILGAVDSDHPDYRPEWAPQPSR